MKKLLIAVLLFFSTQYSNAQVEKGRLAIGGMLSAILSSEKVNPTTMIGRYSEDEGTNVAFTGSPGAMLFIKNGLAFNANLSIGYSNWKSENVRNTGVNGEFTYNYYKNQTNSYGVQVGLTQYKKLVDNFYLTMGGNLGYTYELPYLVTTDGSGNNTTHTSNDHYSDKKINNIGIGFTPGLSYFLSKKIAINANFGSITAGYGWGNEHQETYNSVHNTSSGTTTNYSDAYRDVSKFDLNFRLASSIGLGVQYFLK